MARWKNYASDIRELNDLGALMSLGLIAVGLFVLVVLCARLTFSY